MQRAMKWSISLKKSEDELILRAALLNQFCDIISEKERPISCSLSLTHSTNRYSSRGVASLPSTKR